MKITENHRDQMADFDSAYAHEGMARALSLNGKMEEAKGYYKMAKATGDEISDPESKQIYLEIIEAVIGSEFDNHNST